MTTLRTHRIGISYTPVKEPGRAILSLWRVSKGKGTEGTRHSPGVLHPGSSYFPFAIPTQYFEVRALSNKMMLDAEFLISPAVGSRNLQVGCTSLTVSHYFVFLLFHTQIFHRKSATLILQIF